MIAPKVDGIYWTTLAVTYEYPMPIAAIDVVAVRVHKVLDNLVGDDDYCKIACSVSLCALDEDSEKKPSADTTQERKQLCTGRTNQLFIGGLAEGEAVIRYSGQYAPYRRFSLRADMLYATPDEAMAALCDRLAEKLRAMRTHLIHNAYTKLQPDKVVTNYL